jgi:hypothetical protein
VFVVAIRFVRSASNALNPWPEVLTIILGSLKQRCRKLEESLGLLWPTLLQCWLSAAGLTFSRDTCMLLGLLEKLRAVEIISDKDFGPLAGTCYCSGIVCEYLQIRQRPSFAVDVLMISVNTGSIVQSRA